MDCDGDRCQEISNPLGEVKSVPDLRRIYRGSAKPRRSTASSGGFNDGKDTDITKT